jgi:hypothetical protein
VPDELVGRPGDMNLGAPCQDADLVERHAEPHCLGLQEPAGEVTQAGASFSAASRISSTSTGAR